MVATMTRTPTSTLTATRAQLSELIAALDRRLPQVQRAGEETIANAAVRLRMEAEKRIAELDHEIADRKSGTFPARNVPSDYQRGSERRRLLPPPAP